MRGFRASVRVTLRGGVLDPQGQAVAGALRALGFDGVTGARVGRWIELELEAASEEDARRAVDAMCRRLLANPVIEDYAFDVAPAPAPAARPLGTPLNPSAAARGLPAPGAESREPASAEGHGNAEPARGLRAPLPGSPGMPPLPPGGKPQGGR